MVIMISRDDFGTDSSLKPIEQFIQIVQDVEQKVEFNNIDFYAQGSLRAYIRQYKRKQDSFTLGNLKGMIFENYATYVLIMVLKLLDKSEKDKHIIKWIIPSLSSKIKGIEGAENGLSVTKNGGIQILREGHHLAEIDGIVKLKDGIYLIEMKISFQNKAISKTERRLDKFRAIIGGKAEILLIYPSRQSTERIIPGSIHILFLRRFDEFFNESIKSHFKTKLLKTNEINNLYKHVTALKKVRTVNGQFPNQINFAKHQKLVETQFFNFEISPDIFWDKLENKCYLLNRLQIGRLDKLSKETIDKHFDTDEKWIELINRPYNAPSPFILHLLFENKIIIPCIVIARAKKGMASKGRERYDKSEFRYDTRKFGRIRNRVSPPSFTYTDVKRMYENPKSRLIDQIQFEEILKRAVDLSQVSGV